MNQDRNYHLGLLYLMRLLMGVDGEVESSENNHLRKVKEFEKIPEETLIAFEKEILTKEEKHLYQIGIDYINQCTDEDKLNAFAHLYKLSEADGTVHVKEVRLLLYSFRKAKIEFNDVINRAKQVKYP